ncbi:MAG: hypothetical protein ABIQ55_08375 [Gemmatimonadaceae bacterium]
MQSEYYHLRRTAIKDLAAYCGFLLGFLGSAPLAWELLASQLDEGNFARGLWYFFGIVMAAGIFAGIAGLGVGFVVGLSWEQFHRFRRRARAKEKAALDSARHLGAANDAHQFGHPASVAVGSTDEATPRLRLLSTPLPFPDLTGRRLASIRFLARAIEIDFGGIVVEIGGSPLVTAGSKRFRYPEAGARDALCALIGARVERMSFSSGDRAEMRFDSGWELSIPRSSSAVA